jgi:hypothetical protein
VREALQNERKTRGQEIRIWSLVIFEPQNVRLAAIFVSANRFHAHEDVTQQRVETVIDMDFAARDQPGLDALPHHSAKER